MKRIVIPLFLFFSGCMVGPKYKTPEVCLPETFSEQKSAEACTPSEDCLCTWWKQLNDPKLDAFLEEAFQANFDFLIAIEKIEQARAQYRIENSYLWPEIDLAATATRSLYSKNFFRGDFGNTNASSTSGSASTNGSFPFQNFFQIGLDAIWELDFWGKFRRARNAAEYQWEATQEDAQNVLISVLSEVAVNYVNIRALQQQIFLAQQKIAIDERQLTLALVLFEAGLDNQIDVEALLAALDSDKATLPVLETSLKQSIYALALLLGRQPEGLSAEFQEIQPIPSGFGKVPVGIPSDLLRRRPDIRSVERQLAAATEEIGVAVADLFPHISLTGTTISGGAETGSSYGYQSSHLNNLINTNSRTWSIGPGIRWNLIDFGRTFANIAVQKSLQKQMLLTYEQTIIAALKDVEGALVAYFEEQKRQHFFTGQVGADRRALELTEDLFQAGLVSETQLLTARKTVIDAENALVQSNQALTSDLVALYKALGGSWECTYSP